MCSRVALTAAFSRLATSINLSAVLRNEATSLSLSLRVGDVITTFGLHWLSAPEWLRLLAEAGFEVDALYGWFDLRPHEAEEDLIFVARRAAPSR